MGCRKLAPELPITVIFTLLSYCVVLSYSALLPDINGVSYTWKTRMWSSCSSHVKCGESHRTRKVICQDSDGFIVAESNCQESLKPKTIDHCFRVCEKHKHQLRWLVGEWSRCAPSVLTFPSAPCIGTSIAGVANRTVTCVWVTTLKPVDSSACERLWDKPEVEMACSLDCPQDCVLAKRNVSCTPLWCPSKSKWNTEVSDVVVTSSENGITCPEPDRSPVCPPKFLSKHVCKDVERTQKRYVLKIGEWSPCEAIKDNTHTSNVGVQIALKPVIGISTRNITCLTDEGDVTELSLCNLEPQPTLTRRCVLPVHCQTSPWSEWRVQKEGCITSDGKVYAEIRTRTRRLEQMPVGHGATPCPPLYEERSISQDLPSCYKYQWHPVEWSECEVRLHGPHNNLLVVHPTCGNGLQYRNLICVRGSDMVPVADENCREPRPPTIQPCIIPCRRDCQVSHWSRWGPCTYENNGDDFYKRPQKENVQTGYMRRERSVLVSPSEGGKPCPHLQEQDECDEIGTIDWQYGKWSNCTLADPQATCGMGERSRSKTCVNLFGVPIQNLMCDYHLHTFASEPCRIPCPDDCVLSDWSEWSSCSLPCFSEEDGRRYRTKTYLARAGEGGACWKSKDNETDSCNQFLCEPYRWMAKKWGPCKPVDDQPTSQSCSIGIQRRNVVCTNGTAIAKKRWCKHLKMPETKRECFLPCPVNCLTTNFTDWMPCEPDCGSDAVQYKHRYVIQSAKHGGTPCPEALLEARSCRKALESVCLEQKSENYRWNTSGWSECILPSDSQRCGIGFQVRNVSCVDENGHESEPHHCLSETGWTLTYVPTALRSCEITCSSDCVLTTWTAWSTCGYSYNSKRSRSRELVGVASENSICPPTFKLVEEENCPPASTVLNDLENVHWMSCLLHNSSKVLVNGVLMDNQCGKGYRYKFDPQINSETATGPGLVKDFCLVDCPLDCQMSEWSKWTSCSVPCGKGFKERKRDVLVPGNSLGRPCPVSNSTVEVQRDVCHIVCADFYWLAGGWTQCNLYDDQADCGNGSQHRSVQCIEKWTENVVDESKCDPFLKPERTSECRLHCPGECVVSPWTVTEKCSEPCSPNNYQVKRREILRHPNSTSEACPPLVSRAPCVLNETCLEHTLVKGSWGSCVLHKGSVCGEGVRKRPLLCMRSDGTQVDAVHCEKNHKSVSDESEKNPVSTPCFIYCPLDCIMSQWSAWNKTDCRPCGIPGVMSRTRYVLQLPSDTGQPCPPELEQRTPCEFKACYHWKHSDWSACDLQGADCGFGVRRRLTECVRYDGLKVDKMLCLTLNLTFPKGNWLDSSWLALAQEESHQEDICHVPCPGECVVSEWSRWSHCQKNCRIGQTVGYQTSTRKILFAPRSESSSCPTQLRRTRPCWDDDCNFFRWKLKNGSLICEGKDGIAVEGGCVAESLPCEHWCEKLGGTCNGTTGLCRCGTMGPVLTGPGTISSCSGIKNGPRPPSNHSAPTQDIRLKYYPDDNQVSFWMYAMISIGTAFVIFVVVTVYLMCRSSLRQRSVSVERQPSMRRRANNVSNPVGNHSTVDDATANCTGNRHQRHQN